MGLYMGSDPITILDGFNFGPYPLTSFILDYSRHNTFNYINNNLSITSIRQGLFMSASLPSAVLSLPNCTYIGTQAFYNCTGLTGLSLPNCLSISSSAFANCTGIKKIDLPNCHYIYERGFYNLTDLEEVNLQFVSQSNYYPAIRSYAFYGCDNLKKLNITNNGSLSIYLYSDAFAFNTKLEEVNLSGVSIYGTDILYACGQSASICKANITISRFTSSIFGSYSKSGVTHLTINAYDVASSAFCSCSTLKELTVNLSSYWCEIGSYAFSNCINLEVLNLSLERYDTDFPTGVFTGTGSNASSFVLNVYSSTTYLRRYLSNNWFTEVNVYQCSAMDYWTFANCSRLSKVTFWSDCVFNHINNSCFSNCTNLTELRFYTSTIISLSDVSTFYGTPISGTGSGRIYVPSSLWTEWKSTSHWYRYSNKILSF